MIQLTLELMRMPWPTDWSTVFGRHAPLLVEIGFGNGLFLLDQARQRPELNILGIEIAMPSIKRAAGRLQRADVNNVRLVRGSAQSALQLLCRPGSIQGVTINFPDPWPKASHSGRRLISASFLELLATRMTHGATVDIATDHDEYSEWIAECLLASPHFESRLETIYMQTAPAKARTKYERRGLTSGNSTFYFKWRRNSAAAPDGYHLVEELPMPHAVTRCPLALEEIADSFEPRQCLSGEVSVRFIDLYKSQRRPSLIVDTYVSEQPVDQRLMLEIYQRPDGDYIVRLQATGFPRATGGVHEAIASLTEWLCSLHEDGAVLRHNLRVPLVTDNAAPE